MEGQPDEAAASQTRQPGGPLDAWRLVVGFGVVSLAGDVVYQGGRSIYGPVLGALGASASLVGLITGAGEAMALVLRLVSGPLADRTRAYWGLSLLGYGLTAVCVPLLALSPALGTAGLVFACLMILTERAGKAIRSPAKTALLAESARRVGRGRGFGVHKALDEMGAVLGPLLVAGVIGLSGRMWPALGWLVIPGLAAIGVLLWLRTRAPMPARAPAAQTSGGWWAQTVGVGLGPGFFLFAGCGALTTAGLVSFGVISYHFDVAGVLPLAVIPAVYAAGQLAAGMAALANGFGYDRVGPRVLYALPLLTFMVSVLAFSRTAWIAIVGVLFWGMATGLADSTVSALVADLVPGARRATAYGVFAAIQGGAAMLGGLMAGLLYERSLPALIAVAGVLQIGATVLLAATLRRISRQAGHADRPA